MSITHTSLILAMIMCSSCITTAKRQEAALKTLGASRMYHDAVRFGVLHTGPAPSNRVRFGESITEVDLTSQRKLTDSDLQVLGDLPSLRYLKMDHTHLTDCSMACLKSCPSLRVLGLQDVRITDAALPHIAQLTQLRELDLWGSRVTSDGLRPLLALRHLEKLWLHDTNVTDEVVPILSSLRSLKEVGLGGTDVTAAGKREVRRLRPGITIYPDDSRVGRSGEGRLPPKP